MKSDRLHVKLQRQLTIVIFVVESEKYLELEAVGLGHGTQGLQCDRGEVEAEAESLHGVPGHGQVVLHHPLLARVELLRLLLCQ